MQKNLQNNSLLTLRNRMVGIESRPLPPSPLPPMAGSGRSLVGVGADIHFSPTGCCCCCCRGSSPTCSCSCCSKECWGSVQGLRQGHRPRSWPLDAPGQGLIGPWSAATWQQYHVISTVALRLRFGSITAALRQHYGIVAASRPYYGSITASLRQHYGSITATLRQRCGIIVVVLW